MNGIDLKVLFLLIILYFFLLILLCSSLYDHYWKVFILTTLSVFFSLLFPNVTACLSYPSVHISVVVVVIVVVFTVSDVDQNLLLLTYQPEGDRTIALSCFACF